MSTFIKNNYLKAICYTLILTIITGLIQVDTNPTAGQSANESINESVNENTTNPETPNPSDTPQTLNTPHYIKELTELMI